MLITRELVGRLEAAESGTVARLATALRVTTGDEAVDVRVMGRGHLVATGPGRYVNRAVGITLDPLTEDDVDEVTGWYAARGLPAAVQLSSWAPAETVRVLADRGFAPTGSRTVLVRSTRAAGPRVGPDLVVEVVGDTTAAEAADVMAAGDTSGRVVSDEFMAADRACDGTTQLLARLDGRAVGCGSVTVVGGVGWLGAARTAPDARRRGVQSTLVTHRIDLARRLGCDLVGATASVGSDSARNLQRLGFVLVQDQWVVARPGAS